MPEFDPEASSWTAVVVVVGAAVESLAYSTQETPVPIVVAAVAVAAGFAFAAETEKMSPEAVVSM